MADIEHQITIAHPITEVYRAVTDYENPEVLQSWQRDLRTLGITAGDPLRTGSMIAMKRRFLGSDIFVNLDVTDLQRNKRFELKGIHGRFAYQREIEFAPSGRETLINDKINLRASWFLFWYRPFVRSAIQRQTRREWENLKRQLEA